MGTLLRGAISIRVAGRCVLRAEAAVRDGVLVLSESCGATLAPDLPVAALLDREDLCAALAPGGAAFEVFWERPWEFRLYLRRVRGGAELRIETPDGLDHDAQVLPLRALLAFSAIRPAPDRTVQPAIA